MGIDHQPVRGVPVPPFYAGQIGARAAERARRGLEVIPMHWLYYFYNGISFGCGLLLHWQEQLKPEVIPPPEPLAKPVSRTVPSGPACQPTTAV